MIGPSGGLTVGVKHVAGELHLGRTERIIGGEAEHSGKHAAFETRVFWTPETHKFRQNLQLVPRGLKGVLVP